MHNIKLLPLKDGGNSLKMETGTVGNLKRTQAQKVRDHIVRFWYVLTLNHGR